MHLRSHKRLRTIRASWSRFVNGNESPPLGTSSVSGERMPAEPFYIELPLESVPDGEIRIAVEAHFVGEDQGAYKTYAFYHKIRIQ